MTNINLAAHFIVSKRKSDALCFVGPDISLSYRQLDCAVRCQAHWLEQQGVRADQRIAIGLDDGAELAVLFFAALALGALPLLINPRLDAPAMRHIFDDSDPVIVFGQHEQKTVLTEVIASAAHPTHLRLIKAGMHRDWITPTAEGSAWNGFLMRPLTAPAFIQYTSGTTGQAKGVLHSAASIISSCAGFAAGQLRINSSDLLYSVPKAFFGYGMGNSLFFPLYLGACALLDPAWPTAELVAANLKRYRPNVLFAVPTMYRLLLEEGLQPSNCSLRLAFSAGAPLAECISAMWQQRFGFDLHDGIGATELCHVFATTYPDRLRRGSVGRMLDGWQARIVDEQGALAADDEPGVLLVKAPSMALCYWRRPQDDALKFVDGWYRTGDLFTTDSDGFLYFHGREDERFKVFGRWVMPSEVESLLSQHAGVLGECYLVPGRDATGEDRPVLYIRANDDFEQQARFALATLKTHLESFKYPAKVLPLETLPMTANGKLNRRALASQASNALQAVMPTQHEESDLLC
ncbi:AMP-binding protein [Solimicrobium silvestre]|uniref:Acyl-CoA synthetases (AMP-forming)/AMP-acid ligases II n=1 Tax=Solimicrobium silvestre TaxID=2099400 RepID=A0A2S9H2S3_9BURK|nr:AMP-binding protein [Solimicrobium silvestre]PRC94282.1 Acyl-CoA synthetases (AMP-forming)/AMP-acid ligases II [Solimicrobium silvestre]